MSADDPYVINVLGSEVGHLPAYGAHGDRTLCGMPRVEAALERQSKGRFPLWREATGLRLCRSCMKAMDRRFERLEEMVEAMGGRP